MLNYNIIHLIKFYLFQPIKPKLKKMYDFLSGDFINDKKLWKKCKKGDLWQRISEKIDTYPCMDIVLEIVDENDYYGVDFRGDQKVYELFFPGSSNYFPAIWIGNDDDIEKLDELPIYVLDLSSDENEFECIGNFRKYIEILLNDFLEQYKKNDAYVKMAKIMKEQLKQFSSKTIDKGKYKLKINN